MISYRNEISALFDVYENEEHLSEKEIYQRCLVLIKKHDFDIDYMYDLNDEIYERGYCFQFDVPNIRDKEYNHNEYVSLITNASKSKNRTAELIKYLNDYNDHRLIFASIHALKVRFLIELGILPSDDDWINKHSNDSFRDVLFLVHDNKDEFDVVMEASEKIGLKYLSLSYMQFWYDMEWLLWTIELVDHSKGYIKVNTIKIALGIAPSLFFERGNKKYYDASFSKKLNSYLKLIDKKAINRMKEKYQKAIDNQADYGYKLLYNLL